LAGIILGQAILYGPSLIGQKILLPLDILALPDIYIPTKPGEKTIVPHDSIRLDLVLQFETERRFTATELHAGRFPMWTTYQYAGSPLVWPKFSPFILLGCLTLSPLILPWIQVFEAIVCGLGLYLFCRRALKVSYWAATIPAWCYPMSGFFVFWQGFPTCSAAYWLPWLMLAVDQTIRRRRVISWAGLSVITCLVLISGHIDVAGQALLGAGLYAIWCVWDQYGKEWYQAQGRAALVSLITGWCLGFLLATPHLLPLLEYVKTGARMEHRSGGQEERPPVGLTALPQTVLPDLYGVTRMGGARLVAGNQLESSAAMYVGLLATLLIAPLAWCSQRQHSFKLFCVVLIVLSLSWCVNIPGLVDLLRLPGIRMMSHNRLVFVGSFAILTLTALGWECLIRGEVSRRIWFLVPVAVIVILGGWCLFRAARLPELALSQPWINQMWLTRSYSISGILCGLGMASWMIISNQNISRTWLLPSLGILVIGDLLWFAHDRSAQTDPAYYYPRIPVLEEIARSTNSRILGYKCFPPTLSQTHNLRDIRGYDSIDPGRLVAVMDLALEPEAKGRMLKYASTQWFEPRMKMSQSGVALSPVLDMLSVRYLIFRGKPPAEVRPVFQGDDYWVLPNDRALPRAFVPHRVEVVGDDQERLTKLGSSQFDPREIGYVESPVNLPGEVRGEAQITSEIPTRITVAVKMETPGLLILSDLWDRGWHAYLNGERVPILRTNHAVRGVVVPAGNGTVEFRYESESFGLGLKLALAAGLILAAGVSISAIRFQTPILC